MTARTTSCHLVGLQQGNQQAAPLDVRVAVRNGSATFIDQQRTHPQPFAIDGFAADVALHAVGPSRYEAHLILDEGGTRYPVRGKGLLDDARGWEMQRWTAPRIGIAPLVDFALDPSALTVTFHGNVAIACCIPDSTGNIARHLDADASLAGLTFYLAGLARPVREAHGPLHGFDDGVVGRRLDANLAGAPLRIAGGLVDFAHPTFDLGVVGRGVIEQLITVSPAAARLPVRGDIAFGLLVEGDANRPLLLARFSSPRVAYQRIPVDAVRGSVALLGNELDVLRVTVALEQGYASGQAAASFCAANRKSRSPRTCRRRPARCPSPTASSPASRSTATWLRAEPVHTSPRRA